MDSRQLPRVTPNNAAQADPFFPPIQIVAELATLKGKIPQQTASLKKGLGRFQNAMESLEKAHKDPCCAFLM